MSEPAPSPDGSQQPDPDDDVVARVLGGRRELGRSAVAQSAGAPLALARRFWHALGFPEVPSDEPLFTTADEAALAEVVGLIESGVVDEQTALLLTRSMGRTGDRLAAWQVQILLEAETHRVSGIPASDTLAGAHADDTLDGRPLAVPDRDTALAAAQEMVALAGRLEPLLVYAWRRHLADAVARMVTDASPDPAAAAAGQVRSVGFADLVGFTGLLRRLSEHDVAEVVEHFEQLATDIVTAHGARVVKTLGDEIMFASRGAGPAAAIALDLAEAMEVDPLLPQVRVGVARGPVVSRLGDVFGTTVNRASRLTAMAYPSAVVTDAAQARAVTEVSGFAVSPLRRRSLRGLGPVRPYVLRRASGAIRGRGLAPSRV